MQSIQNCVSFAQGYFVHELAGNVRLLGTTMLDSYLRRNEVDSCWQNNSVGIKDNGMKIVGLPSVVKHLVKKSGKNELLGITGEEKALVYQWLEYTVTVIGRLTTKTDFLTALKELDKYLEDKVFLVGFYPTVADLVLYYGLHKTFCDLSFQQKQYIVHVSRWFNQVQNLDGVQQHFGRVLFQKNLIYSKFTH